MSDTSANNKRIAKNSAFMSIRMVIVLFITFYSSRVLLDVLGVEDYGINNVVAGFAAMFSFLNTSLSNGIQRFYNFELGKHGLHGAKLVFNAAIIIQTILAIIILIPTEIFGVWYLNNVMVIPAERLFAANWIFQFATFSLVIHIVQVPFTASVMAHESMGFYAIVNVLYSLLTLLGAMSLPYLGQDTLILYGVLLASLALLMLLAYVCHTRICYKEVRFSRDVPQQLFKEMLGFSGWNIFGTCGQMLKDQGVNLVLNAFFGPVVNAARGIALQVNSGLQNFVSNITTPVRPQVIQSYAQENYSRTYSLTYTVSKMTSYFLLMLAIPVLLEIDYILNIWLGDNVPPQTAIYVVIIVLNSLVLNLNGAVSNVVHASGKMRNYQLAGGCMSLLAVIAAYLGVIIWRLPETAFMALLLTDIVRQAIALVILKRIENSRFTVSNYLHKVIKPIIVVVAISTIIPISIHFFMYPGIMRFIMVTISSVLSVLIFTYKWGLVNSERIFVKQVLYKLKTRFYK